MFGRMLAQTEDDSAAQGAGDRNWNSWQTGPPLEVSQPIQFVSQAAQKARCMVGQFAEGGVPSARSLAKRYIGFSCPALLCFGRSPAPRRSIAMAASGRPSTLPARCWVQPRHWPGMADRQTPQNNSAMCLNSSPNCPSTIILYETMLAER